MTKNHHGGPARSTGAGTFPSHILKLWTAAIMHPNDTIIKNIRYMPHVIVGKHPRGSSY